MKFYRGFTLIELMIALVLGLFIIGVTLTVYLITIKGSSETLKSARLNHDIELAMSIMINDIRRAGYWGGAITGSDSFENPFTSGLAAMQIPNSNCILYSYDADAGDTGVPGTDIDADEYYGFKLDGNTIRMRLTGTNNTDCNDGEWGSGELIDSEIISVDSLTFSPLSTCLNVDVAPIATSTSNTISCSSVAGATNERVIERRQVNVTIEGSLVSDPSVTKTLTSTVIVRNDNLYRIP